MKVSLNAEVRAAGSAPPLEPPRALRGPSLTPARPRRNRPPLPQDKALQKKRMDRWEAVDPATRAQVKDLVIRTLTSGCGGARRAAAQVVGKIAFIEFKPAPSDDEPVPDTTWPELLGGLSGWIQNEALPEPVRAASLTALSYVVEELDRHERSPLSKDQVDAVTNLVLGALSAAPPTAELQKEAVKALRVLLPFMTADFSPPEPGSGAAEAAEWARRAPRRDAVMERVRTLAAGALLPATQEEAFLAAATLAELYYDAMPPYMPALAALTHQFVAVPLDTDAAKVRRARARARAVDGRKEGAPAAAAHPPLPCLPRPAPPPSPRPLTPPHTPHPLPLLSRARRTTRCTR